MVSAVFVAVVEVGIRLVEHDVADVGLQVESNGEVSAWKVLEESDLYADSIEVLDFG